MFVNPLFFRNVIIPKYIWAKMECMLGPVSTKIIKIVAAWVHQRSALRIQIDVFFAASPNHGLVYKKNIH